jgi:hypothetical protein
MSWWTDVRDTTLGELGLSTPQDVVATAGAVAQAAVGGDNGVKKDIPVVQRNPFQLISQSVSGLGGTKILGVSLPIVLVALGAGYFLLRKR